MKKYIILIASFIVCIILSIFINNYLDKNSNYTENELKFKKEYESINNSEWEISGYKGNYLEISIPKNNLIKYASNDNIVDLLSKGTQVIYFGNSKCNWCRSAITVLIDTAKEDNLNEIYYYDFFSLRDAYEEGSNKDLVKLYDDIMVHLGDFIEKTFDENSKVAGKKRLSAPTVVIVSNGKVEAVHYKTVDSHVDYNKNLDSNQKNELKTIYKDMFDKLVYACTDNC